MSNNAPARGVVFTHQRYLDVDRQPARMKVTSVSRGRVYFTYADEPTNKGAFYLGLDTWVERYGS